MQLPKRKPGKYTQVPLDNAMSQEKHDELERKLNAVKKKRPALAQEVSRLAELGDFSENVEYQLAKGKLRGVNSAILKIEYQINHSEIIKPKNNGTIQLGNIVTIKTNKGEKTYTILGATEANPSKGIISHQSPLGSALLGHKIGDVIDIKKAGTIEIIEIL